jgi:hypothetical protein
MLAWSRAFMLPWTFAFVFELPVVVAAPVFEFAAVAAGDGAALPVLAFDAFVLRAVFALSAVEHPATRTHRASKAGSISLLIPSLPYPTGVKVVRAS